jgi:hypothetical protein
MSTSQTTTGLSRPTTDEKISLGTMGYINARNRQRAYDIVIGEFKHSGISQAALASRLGKPPEVVSRWLSRPQNWESDTFSSLLFGISGAIPRYTLEHPLGKQKLIERPVFENKMTSNTAAKIFRLDAYRPNGATALQRMTMVD